MNDNIGTTSDFVLEKSIFSNIFEKDIRRVYVYKKAERLAKAIHLVAPAFAGSMSLMNRLDGIALGLVDAAILPPLSARGALSRELLALSSILAIARASGLLSPMNCDLIAREAQQLLQEIAAYEEPRIALDDAPSLAAMAKDAARAPQALVPPRRLERAPAPPAKKDIQKDTNHLSDNKLKDRRNSVLSVISQKGQATIKDISTVILGVSEKTIQRELQYLIESGVIVKQGERRWTTYSLAAPPHSA